MDNDFMLYDRLCKLERRNIMANYAEEVLILMDKDLHKRVKKFAFDNGMTLSDFIGISCLFMLNDLKSFKEIKKCLDNL